MNIEDQLQGQLDQLGYRLARTVSVAEQVMYRIAQTPEAERPHTHNIRRFIVKSSMSIAACVIVGVGAWLVFSFADPQTLYAQANKAIEEARTIYIVGKRFSEGRWVTEAKVFYERGVGVAEYGYRNGQTTYLRVDNGKDAWRRSPGGHIVRSKSHDPVGVIKKTLRYTVEKLQEKYDVSRDPSGDRKIDGIPCKLYVSVHSSVPSIKRLWWFDKNGAVRRWEKQRKQDDGQWEASRAMEIRYGIPIDRSHFTLESVPETQEIDAHKLFGDKFSLDKALFKKETHGLIFAVHELRRVEGDMVYLLASLRATLATEKELGPMNAKGRRTLGDFMVMSGWKRIDGVERSHQPYTIGELYNDKLKAQWVLLQRKGTWPKKVKNFELSVNIYARGKLQERLKAKDKVWWLRLRPIAILPLPEKQTPFVDVLYRTYAAALVFEPIVFDVRLPGPSRRKRAGVIPMYQPRKLSPPEHAEAVERLFADGPG